MSGHYVLGEDGRTPVRCENLLAWIGWFESAERMVAETIRGDVRVHTVFLGIDHNLRGRGGPVLFETMIFGGPLDGYWQRYETWAEAEEGHAEVVALVFGEGVAYGPRTATNETDGRRGVSSPV